MPIQRVDVKSVGRLREQNPNLFLVDVRTPAEYETIHAAGAKLAPLTELDPKKVMAGRSEDEPVYLICKAGMRSMKAAEAFANAGFKNVHSVDGGTDAWVAAGLPSERKGRNVLPLDRQVQSVAGSICLAGVILGTWVNPWFYLLAAMVGFGLTMAGLTGFCPMAILLAKMPWNQGSNCGSCCSPRQ